VPLALLAVAVLVTGCGGRSRTDRYRGDVNTVKAAYEPRLQQLETQLRTDVRAHRNVAAAGVAARAAVLYGRLAAGVANLKPPSPIHADAQKLVRAFQGFADSVASYGLALRIGDSVGAQRALNRYAAAQRQEIAAINALNGAK
jgi:hypothetical protein